MTSGPEKLEFRQGWIAFFAPVLPLLILPFIMDASIFVLDWVNILILASIVMAVAPVFSGRSVVRIDDQGVDWDGKGFAPWSDIEACAASYAFPLTLRLFLRERATRARPRQVDISFNGMKNAHHALERALQACAAWIVATRDPAITASPIRDFAEPPSPPRDESRMKKIAFFVLGLLVPLLPVVLSVLLKR